VVAFLTASAFAAWDWANPAYGTFATQAQMDTISGVTPGTSTPISIAVDTDGSLIVDNDPGGGDGNFIDINAAGGGSGGSIIISEADLYNATPQVGDSDLDIDRVVVASDGSIYLSEHDSDDDVMKLTGRPATASSVNVVPGVVDIALDETNSRLLAYIEGNFASGGPDAISIVALPGGAISDAATAAQIQAVTGAAGVGSTACALMPDGKLAFYDEANFGGSDAVYTLENPGPSPTIASLYPTSMFTSAPGLSNLNVTPQGDIVAWNEFDATSSRLTIIPSGALSSADLVEFTETDLQTAFGIGATFFQPTDQGSIALKVATGTPNQLVIFLANVFADNNIYTITFNEIPAGVSDWTLYL